MNKFVEAQITLVLFLCTFLGDLSAEPVKFARFEYRGEVAYGIVEGKRVHILEGTPFEEYRKTGKSVDLDEVRLLVPCEPTKIFGAVANIPAAEAPPKPKPDHPEFFYKAPSALIADGEAIVLPAGANQVKYEGEMVAVIGKRARKVSVSEAAEYVLGITCGNDVSGGDWPDDFQLWRSKGCDTFAPCGPFIVAGLDWNDLDLELRLNGEPRQRTNTSRLIHSIPEIVSFISQYMTLEPGDLIYTGTQPPIDILKPGDVVEVELEGVGTLTNRVVRDKE